MKECNLLQTYEIFLKIMYLKLLQEYWTYEWDLWNRLVKVVQYNAPDNGECVEVSYEYDVLNHRISRTTDSETTKYAYGRNGALAYQEKTVDGSAFISEDPARDGANWYGYAGCNTMVYMDRIGLFYYTAEGQQSSTSIQLILFTLSNWRLYV